MGLSQDTERKALAAAAHDTSRAIEELAESLHRDYWGSRKDFVPNDPILKGLASLTHFAYKHQRTAAHNLVEEAFKGSPKGCPPLKNYGNTETFVRLSARLDMKGLRLQQDEQSMLKLLLTFYGVEIFFVPALALAWGFSRISVGDAKTWQEASIKSDGKLCSIEDVSKRLSQTLYDMKSFHELGTAVLGIRALLQKVSRGTDGDAIVINLADVRNITGHHDLVVQQNGSALWGFNYLYRAGLAAPQKLSAQDIDRHWKELNGAYTLLTSWISTVHLVHDRLRI